MEQQTISIGGVTLHLAHPDELKIRWVGQQENLKQLLAAWTVIETPAADVHIHGGVRRG